MKSLELCTLPILFSCLLHFLTKSQGQAFVYCNTSANYTSGSVYNKNLNLLLSSLAVNPSTTGFNMTTVGQDPYVVYGLIQCRADVSNEDCLTCSSTSSMVISQRCPNEKEAFIQYDSCSLRYSDWHFFSTVNTIPRMMLLNVKNVTNPIVFSDQLGRLLRNILSRAASSPSLFAVGSTIYMGSTNIYGMMQCTRDLTGNNCLGCLQEISKDIPSHGSEGGQVISLSCSLRYEITPFFLLSSPPPPSPPPPPPLFQRNSSITGSNDGKKKTLRTIGFVTIPAAIAFLLVSIIWSCFLWRSRRKTKEPSFVGVHEYSSSSSESLLFDLMTLKVATRNFSDENKLGQGGFGPVYKGELNDGREIAVKRLRSGSEQGIEELRTEVMLVTKLQHRNLVRLLGFCLEEEEKLLVYEYLPNGSLDMILFDRSRRFTLEWERRYNIVFGIARGLLYLHEDSQLRIIHRDMKASNILLDEYMNPKISDFGLAKLFYGSQTQGNTDRIAGTLGYMAPEYAQNGHFSTKSDVYSFGVLVLEIVMGQKNSGFPNSKNLQNHARQHWAHGTALDLMDPTLGDQWPKHEVLKCIQIGILCTQKAAADRPSMSDIVLMLCSNTVTTPVPFTRSILAVRRTFESYGPREEDFDADVPDKYNERPLEVSVNEVTNSELSPRN